MSVLAHKYSSTCLPAPQTGPLSRLFTFPPVSLSSVLRCSLSALWIWLNILFPDFLMDRDLPIASATYSLFLPFADSSSLFVFIQALSLMLVTLCLLPEQSVSLPGPHWLFLCCWCQISITSRAFSPESEYWMFRYPILKSFCFFQTCSSFGFSGWSPGGGHGNPLQYPCLENPMNRGTCWAPVHRVEKSDTTEAIVKQSDNVVSLWCFGFLATRHVGS